MFNKLNARICAGVFWIIVGILFGLGSLKLNIGNPREPGPGLIPLITSVFLICLCLLSMAVNRETLKVPNVKDMVGYPLLIGGSVILYLLLLKYAHFLLSTVLLMLVIFAVFSKGEGGRVYRVIAYATGTAIFSWLIFVVGLGIPFP